MKAEELRIGNWVISPVFSNVELKLTPTRLVNFFHGMDTLEPIPLTEEWLLKFGFEKWVDGVYYINYSANGVDNIKLRVFEDIGHIFIDFEKVWMINCTHVHQLQNLYHALTGEELKIIKE